MGHMYLAMAAKLKSAAGGKESNDHEMSKTTITKKNVVECGL